MKKVFRTNKGRGRNIISASEWEPIPQSDRKHVGFVDTDPKALSSNAALDAALKAALADVAKEYPG